MTENTTDFVQSSSISHPSLQNDIVVLPPWPMGQHAAAVPHSENWFRTEQGWADKFVVMFSGNHSWVHPLGTILDAAERLADDPRFLFVFIGGGKGKAEVDERVERLNVGSCSLKGESATSNKQQTTSSPFLINPWK